MGVDEPPLGLSPPAGCARAGKSHDPVGHLYPPLVGPVGRAYHGTEHEHHPGTLERHRAEMSRGPETRLRPPGPTHRPERLYLHYLLLHLDELSPSALQYLRRQSTDEVAHRARPLLPPAE